MQPPEVGMQLVLVASPEDAALDATLDGKDDRPGWSCPNGLALSDNWIGGWVPGFDGESLLPGFTSWPRPGGKLVLTMHYTSENGQVGPDQTSLDFTLADSVSQTLNVVTVVNPAWLAGGMKIPAGDPDVSYSYEVDPFEQSLGRPVSLWDANLHMHEHGSKALIGVRHADGSTSCLLEIPAWNYHWVGEDYFLQSPVKLVPGDRIYVECHWDNSAGHQIVVNGVPQTPRDLNWGNDQEMCVGFADAPELRYSRAEGR